MYICYAFQNWWFSRQEQRFCGVLEIFWRPLTRTLMQEILEYVCSCFSIVVCVFCLHLFLHCLLWYFCYHFFYAGVCCILRSAIIFEVFVAFVYNFNVKQCEKDNNVFKFFHFGNIMYGKCLKISLLFKRNGHPKT